MKSSEKKKGLDMGKMKRDREARKGDGFFKLQNGKTRVVMVMGKGNSADTFYVLDKRFFVPLKDGQKKGSYIVSPRAMDKDAPCITTSICNALKADKREDVRKLAGDRKVGITFADRYLANAFVKEGDKWVYKVLQFPYSVFQDIADAIAAETEESSVNESDVLENPPIVGKPPRVIVINREGNDFSNTRYTVSVTGTEVSLTKEQRAQVQDLYKFLTPTPENKARALLQKFLNTDDLEAVLEGDYQPSRKRKNVDPDVDDEEEDDEEDEAPKAKTKKKQSRDDEEDEDEDDDEEDEAPKKKKKTKSKSDEDEEDDSDEEDDEEDNDDSDDDDEEDDDDETPKKKTKKKQTTDDDEEEDDEDEDDSDEDEEDDEPKKKKSSKVKGKAKKKSDDDEEEDDDEDEDEDDEEDESAPPVPDCYGDYPHKSKNTRIKRGCGKCPYRDTCKAA